MNITDFVIIAVFSLAFLRGWTKGIFQVLLGPISLAVAWSLSYYILKTYNNTALVITLGIFGPFIIYLIIKIFIKFLISSTLNKKGPLILSRLIGASLSLAWYGTFFTLLLIITLVLPIKQKQLIRIQNNIKHSQTFSLIPKNFQELLTFPRKFRMNTNFIKKHTATYKRIQSQLSP